MAHPNPVETLPETSSVLERVKELRRLESAEGSTDEDLDVTGEIARDISKEVFARPVQSWDDVVDRAAIAFYWLDGHTLGGVPALISNKSSVDVQATAELIMAVLSLHEGGRND